MDIDEAKRRLEEAIETYAQTVNDDSDSLSGYVLQIVKSNINDMSQNWYSPPALWWALFARGDQ